jgi:negative regulator of sigma E activity
LKAGATPLPEIAWERLSRRISAAVDAEISRADSEDQKLDAMLRSAPRPDVNWERFAEHLSNAIAVEAAKEEARPAVIGRIGWVRRVSQFAVAACVLLAAAVGLRSYVHRGGPVEVTRTVVAVVETPAAEKASEPAVAEVSIGPSKGYAAASDDEVYRRGVAANRSPVVIVTPVDVHDDSDRGLMFE